MGADTFIVLAAGKTAAEAFDKAVREAQHEYGHGRYTGTIAEKSSFVTIDVIAEAKRIEAKLRKNLITTATIAGRKQAGLPPLSADELAKERKRIYVEITELRLVRKRHFAVADHLIGIEDHRVEDKWGPAGCVAAGAGKWVFFGWASS